MTCLGRIRLPGAVVKEVEDGRELVPAGRWLRVGRGNLGLRGRGLKDGRAAGWAAGSNKKREPGFCCF